MIAVAERKRTAGKQPAQPAARYTSAQAATAAGIDTKTLNNWLGREPQIVLLSDEERREAGEKTRYSFDFNRVMQIAVTAELVRAGLQPRFAALSAAAFTDLNTGTAADGRPMRRTNPGALFSDGRTYLVVPPEGDPAKVVQVLPDTNVITLFDPEYGRPFDTATVVRLDTIFHRVALRLGIRVD